MSEISKAFAGLAGSEGALVTYIMGGDPDPDTCSKVIDAVVAGGADILELGIPFSDPIADGKSIQAAAVRALSAGTTPRRVLELAKNAKEKHHVPVALMTYFNIFYSQGFENFLRLVKSHSIDGIIVPDLPLDEASRYARISRRMGVDNILLAAPTTSAGRMRMLASNTSGFLYLVSVLGVTGARQSLRRSTLALIAFAHRYTQGRVPLAVGFGISAPEHVREVIEAGADGVIVGSSIVDRVAEYRENKSKVLQNVEEYVRSLKAATRG